jgi:pimeloyl-ACP methyl ester carboxylesterase
VLRPLTALIGLTGAAALVNHRLRETSTLPHDCLGGVRKPWTWRGYDIFVTEAGSGPPILLVHSLYPGACSFEFRFLVPILARTHRVIAFDLLGCGLSAMPDISYSADLYVEHIVDAVKELVSEPVCIVGSSLGAAFSIQAAARAADQVRALIGICPTGLGDVLGGDPTPAQRSLAVLLRTPVVGESTFNGMASSPALRRFLRTQIYADPQSVTKDVIDHYYAVTHQPGARFVPAHYAAGLLNCNVARDLPFVAAPLLVIWGEQASRFNPLGKAGEYVRLAKDARLITILGSGLLPHEENPDASATAIESFLAQQR